MDEAAQPPHAPRVRVASRGDHRFVVAARSFAPGEPILAFEGVVVDRPSRFSVQIDEDRHLDPLPDLDDAALRERYPWVFLNHACNPNAVRRELVLVAAIPIRPGEEITFDYETSEERMTVPFRCRCGAPGCTHAWVRGFSSLSEAERERRLASAAAWLRRRHANPAADGRAGDS